jgi:hypothetical protein
VICPVLLATALAIVTHVLSNSLALCACKIAMERSCDERGQQPYITDKDEYQQLTQSKTPIFCLFLI